MSKMSKRPTVLMPTAEEDEAITAAARSDPDAQPLRPKQLKAMLPVHAEVDALPCPKLENGLPTNANQTPCA